MTKRDFINGLIYKLKENDSLDPRNFGNEEQQEEQVRAVIEEFIKDFTIISGEILQ